MRVKHAYEAILYYHKLIPYIASKKKWNTKEDKSKSISPVRVRSFLGHQG